MAKQDKRSAVKHPIVIDEFLTHKKSQRRVPGLFPSPRLFAYKQLRGHNKKGTAGQNGKGAGVNNGINPEEFSMHYIKVDGSGGLFAKHKVKLLIKTSQCIGMHPVDRLLLGVKWRD